MRIASATAYEQAITNLQQRQERLTDAQVRLTSGLRVMRASDDPTAASRAERLLSQQTRAEVSQRAVDASRAAMTVGESALGDAVDLLQSAREAVLAAGNASYSPAERTTLAVQLRELRGELLSVANRPDGAGGHVFGGQGAVGQPFIDSPGGVLFAGVAGAQRVGTDERLPRTIDGQMSWMQVPTGNGSFLAAPAPGNTGQAWVDAGRVLNPQASPSVLAGDDYEIVFTAPDTYTIERNGAPLVVGASYQSGQAIQFDGISLTVSGAPAAGDRFSAAPSSTANSVFDGLDRSIAALETPDLGPGEVQQAVVHALSHLDASLGRIQAVRSEVGEMLRRIDGVTERLGEVVLSAQTDRSAAVDLDLVSAISSFQNQQAGYQAALQSYAQVQQMSLFQYLR